jgi:hypothetical protein
MMTITMTRREKAERLQEIKDEIGGLMDEVRGLLVGTGITWERARMYWYAHIVSNLDDDRDYGHEAFTMQSAIEELLEKESSDW